MRILIIDDNPADRELAIRALDKEFAGAEFVEIGRRPEFNAALALGGFDAVLSDFRLHWTDGLWVLKEVKEHHPYVPVVFMTESGSEEIAVEAMKAGLSDYVLKHHAQRLPIALRESLETSRLRRGYDEAMTELSEREAALQVAHAALGQAHQELERRVAERTADLARANENLRRQGQDLRAEMAERRKVEEERERLLADNRRQRELLEHLIAAAPIGIAVVSGVGHCYELANPAYLAITGKPANLPGRPFGGVSPDLRELATELLQPACETGQTVSIREFERPAQGQPEAQSYWDMDAVPLHDASGNVADVLVLISDVTQKVLARRQAEELAIQLAAERRFLDSVMDNVPAVITYLDQGLIYRQCNRSAAHEFGLPVKLVLGRHLREVVPGNPHLWEAVEGVLRTGEPYISTMSVRWQNRVEGRERHYLVAFLADKDEAGGVRGVFAEGQDITEVVEARHRLEELAGELSAARDQLELRVQERTAELEAIFASLPDALYVGDETGIRRCNQIALDNLGCRSIEDLRDSIPALNAKLHNRYADTGERILPEDEAFARALRGQPWTCEVISRNLTTGQDIIQRCAARPILRDGRVTGAVAVHTDITAQKRAEAQREAMLHTLRYQQRRLQILHEMDQAILAAQSPAAVAAAALPALVDTTAALGAMAVLFDAGSTSAEVLAAHGVSSAAFPRTLPLEGFWTLAENRQGRPGVIEDVAAMPDEDPMRAPVLAAGVRCFASIPLLIAGQVIGAILVGYAEPGPLPDASLDFVRQVADQLAVGIHNARLLAEVQLGREHLRSLSHHLVTLQEDERKSLSRELHDRSGQSMSALMLSLGALKREAADAEAVRTHVDDLLHAADGILTELHDLAVNLRPSALDRYGLVPAVEQYLNSFRKNNQIEVQFVATGLDGERLPDDTETALYRILQEALTNVTRHARATSVGIVLNRRGGEISLVVEDDGLGFDVDEALRRGRLGLLGMRERAEMLGGTLAIESAPGRGTTVYVQVGVRPAG